MACLAVRHPFACRSVQRLNGYRSEHFRVRGHICSKMLKKLSEKLGAKFPATTHGYSMVKFARLNDAFLEVFFTASKPSRRPITAAKRKGEKGKAKKKFKNQKA